MRDTDVGKAGLRATPPGWQLGRHRQALLAQPPRRQRAHNRIGAKRAIFAPPRNTLANEERRSSRQIVHLHVHVAAEAVVEGQLEVGRLAERAMWADLDAVATEDAAVERLNKLLNYTITRLPNS